MRLSTGRQPPSDGIAAWRYPQNGLMLHAPSRETLEAQIFEYRLRNNINPGDPHDDVDRYYCALYPSFCHPEPHDINPALPRQSSESMLNRVSRWAAALVRSKAQPRGGYELVTQSVAESRAVICSNCPKNAGWRGGCGGCSGSTLQLLQTLKQMKKTKHDGNLSGCVIGGWENGASVWLPAECTPITTEQRAAMPDKCWRKQLP